MKKLMLTMACVILAGVSFANHWTPIGGTQYNMTMSGIILIDGVEQMNTTLEVGAFCGDECRGSMLPEFFPPSAQYVVSLTVVSNQMSGEEITFRLYDHATQQELDLVSVNDITFESNAIIGTLGDWYEFSFIAPSSTQTYTLPITGFGESNGNYYLIAPPFDNINPAEVEGMTDNVFDLYYFDQSQTLEWQNYKNHSFNLESGKGYLYAHKTDIVLSFTGTPYSGNGIVYLDYDANCELKGWNLVGNPFGQTVYIDRDYYTTNTEGTDIIAGKGNAIAAMQGIFVVAASDGEEMVFSTEAPTNTGNKLVLNIRNDHGNVIDRALIRFGQGRQLPKFMLNEDNTKLYIQQADNDYAVVRSENENAMSVNFKAAENGVYTLNIDTENIELDYLHLIDNITGADINLLQTPNYTFEANTTDYANRFNLVYKKNTGIEEHGQSSFCIVNGKSLLFCEDAEGAIFSLFDMSGRTVCKETLQSNQMSLVGLSGGVYVVRLNKGNELKTQKIVLK